MIKEKIINKNPLFLKYLNNEVSLTGMLLSFSRSADSYTADVAQRALESPPDLSRFHGELEGAVRDIIKNGPDDSFKAFVNHYMEPSLEQETRISKGSFGENQSSIARIKDEDAPWVQGFICYNLCLYIKAFGLQELKSCKVCDKLFAHKGKYALYCSDACKPKKKTESKPKKNYGPKKRR